MTVLNRSVYRLLLLLAPDRELIGHSDDLER